MFEYVWAHQSGATSRLKSSPPPVVVEHQSEGGGSRSPPPPPLPVYGHQPDHPKTAAAGSFYPGQQYDPHVSTMSPVMTSRNQIIPPGAMTSQHEAAGPRQKVSSQSTATAGGDSSSTSHVTMMGEKVAAGCAAAIDVASSSNFSSSAAAAASKTNHSKTSASSSASNHNHHHVHDSSHACSCFQSPWQYRRDLNSQGLYTPQKNTTPLPPALHQSTDQSKTRTPIHCHPSPPPPPYTS